MKLKVMFAFLVIIFVSFSSSNTSASGACSSEYDGMVSAQNASDADPTNTQLANDAAYASAVWAQCMQNQHIRKEQPPG